MNTPKRAVHMTTVHHPYDPRIYHKECYSLQQAGYDVTLIAQESSEAAQTYEAITHIPVKTYSSRIKRMIFGSLAAYRQAKKLKADVYYFHVPDLLLSGWLLKTKDNVVIYDIHEDYVTGILQKEYMSRPLRQFAAKLYQWVEKIFTRKMELCLAEKYYYDRYGRGTCILNYPLLQKPVLQPDHGEEPLADKLVYNGNVTTDRVAHIHAKITAIDPQVTFHFDGSCTRELAEEMYEVAGDQRAQLEIEGIDRFVEKADIEATYTSENWLAGIALFPPTEHYMKKELTKFFEYMNAGLPVICSDFPEWKQFIEEHECGIAVDPYNDTEIKEAIAYLRTHQAEAKQMGENGKQAVQNELNWHTEEKKLINWYDELLQTDENRRMKKDRAEN